MDSIPLHNLEQRAELATTQPAFRVNIRKIRQTVYDILQNWRSSGFFAEYTDHSFDHVIDMLKAASWIIPDQTKNEMTDADYLLLVLAIYFHDLGMLITTDEYNVRHKNADFQAFIESSSLTTEKKREYTARLNQLEKEDSDKFQYQEYVRASHGKRIAAWLSGRPLDDSGATSAAAKAVYDLVASLDDTFRADLALVCRSHTLNDIDNTDTYRVSRPYGSEEETANVQYIAVVLRTIDLLQISRRRAPSVLFQLINPANPFSQIEWLKQGGVRSVRAADARDRDGNVTTDTLRDTIEVHATFDQPAAFFGLTSYLSYAEKELEASYIAIQKSSKQTLKKYLFPWRNIDTKNIDTIGFLTESFEFELDQHKILDLLTGHTLYNNSTVVLRELTQNALDAVRLQSSIDGTDSNQTGKVDIRWNSVERTLVVSDNGTGMSQAMIVNHLLKVGSSRYQDPKFKEDFPKFHSISRFGIGVLSAFMVSDDVEITTCHPDDDDARQIALQSVHGKYLIKLLNKITDRPKLPMLPHGTSVKLTLRPTAEIGNVLDVARGWLMFPRCKVTVYIDDAEPVDIGYSTPKEALESYIESNLRQSRFKREYTVREVTDGGVTLAFTVAKDDLFGDWGFVTTQRHSRNRLEQDFVPVSTCVEGVAVENSTPGFRGVGILAVANAVGPNAPRTNVARSALEDTEEQSAMMATVYRLLATHVSSEVERLAASDSYSLSRAVGVAPYVASALINPAAPPVNRRLLTDAMAAVPLVLIEDGESRKSISIKDLEQLSTFITIESPLYRSIEYFVKEAPADVTARSLLTTLGNKTSSQVASPVVCNMTSSLYLESHVKALFDIVEAVALEGSRAVELVWNPVRDEHRWFSMEAALERIIDEDMPFYSVLTEARERVRQSRNRSEVINIPTFEVKTKGLNNYSGSVSNREVFLKSDVPLSQYFLGLHLSQESNSVRELAVTFLVLDSLLSNGWSWDIVNTEILDRAMAMTIFSQLRNYISNREALISALRSTPQKFFDAFAWDRREGSDGQFDHF